jgi:hypothetical protein
MYYIGSLFYVYRKYTAGTRDNNFTTGRGYSHRSAVLNVCAEAGAIVSNSFTRALPTSACSPRGAERLLRRAHEVTKCASKKSVFFSKIKNRLFLHVFFAQT